MTMQSTDAAVATGETDLAPSLEAVLFSADRPTPAERIAEALGLIEPTEEGADKGQTAQKIDAAARAEALGRVEAIVAELNRQYEASGRSFRIEKIAGGFRVMTLPRFAQVIAEFHRARMGGRLSRQAVETLAIIAYKQPITRAELEAIRGVSCGEVLKTLIERRLVTVKGRAEELGRPLLYGTTKPFLDHFGLSSIKDLPTLEELKPVT